MKASRPLFMGRSAIVAAVAVLSTAGCSAKPAPAPSPLPTAAPETVLPGDAIRVRIWREPDLSGEFEVDSRGHVVLPLIGEIRASERIPDELRSDLVTRYEYYLQNPSIEVTVLRRVLISGEVRVPGLYPVDGTVSLGEVLALAGGLAPNGNRNDINLVRDSVVVRQSMDPESAIGPTIRSGDQIVVGEKNWIARNPGAVVGSFIAATAIIAAALINN